MINLRNARRGRLLILKSGQQASYYRFRPKRARFRHQLIIGGTVHHYTDSGLHESGDDNLTVVQQENSRHHQQQAINAEPTDDWVVAWLKAITAEKGQIV